MYNEKIEKLIEYALSDGEITEKEKEILFKKAKEEGIDLDELEMVLDARLHEKRKSDQDKKAESEREHEARMYERQRSEEEAKKNNIPPPPPSNKHGGIRKCPACGALVQSFSTECSDCGHEYANVEANSSVTTLFMLLNGTEDTRSISISGNMGDILSSNIGGNVTDNKKREIIKNFPIPTTKEDILEFLAMAIPNATEKGSFFTKMTNDSYARHNEFTGVWRAKCEQIIIKARLSMKEDQKTLEDVLFYAKKIKID